MGYSKQAGRPASRVVRVALLLALVFNLMPGLVGTPIPVAEAHNLDQRMSWIQYDATTRAMLDSRVAANDPQLFKVGDEVGMLIKVVPTDGTTTGAGGYVTFYVPAGVQVVGAGYMAPDGNGNYSLAPMKGQSIAPLGYGPIGPASTPQLVGLTLGPNAVGQTSPAVSSTGVHWGTLAGVYGDTGIFYSTSPDTAWQSWVGSNPPLGTSIKNNSGDLMVPNNKWDAEQMYAWGISSPVSPIVDPNGRGSAPWGTASAVAGPQSGYAWQFDKDIWDASAKDAAAMRSSITTGPWNRIQYPGSLISKDIPGNTDNTLGFVGVDASTMGHALSSVNPLPANTNAVRWSVGALIMNRSEYAWVKVKLLNPTPYTNCAVFRADTFGGDAGGENGGKDHLWRYYDPTSASLNACLYVGKRASREIIPSSGVFQYTVDVVNTSANTTMTNVQIQDLLPSGVTFLSATPTQNSGPNPLQWNLTSLAPGKRFQATVTVQAKSSGLITNQVTVTSNQMTGSAKDDSFVGSMPLLAQNKTASPTAIAPGGSVQYTIKIDNIGTASSSSPVKITEYLPAGFTYLSLNSVTINGANGSGVTTVNSTNPAQPIFTVSQAIQSGKSLLLTFTAKSAAGIASGTYCNSYTSETSTLNATGSLACVTVGGGRIGDTIFRDWNNNGVQDAGEEGIPGVTVTLSGASGATAVTDANGNYLFTGLVAGNYTVAVTGGIPAGYTATGPATSPASVTLATNEQRLNVDFSYRPGGTGSIGDLVYKDIANDGVFNGADSGIANVTVWLYEDTNSNGVIDSGDMQIASAVTNGSGIYTFSGLATGLSYIVDVNESDPDLAAAFSPNTFTNSTPALQPVPALSGSYLNADFGYFPNLPNSIGDQVFIDANNNGIYNSGETLLAGVTVKLYRDANGDGIADSGELAATTSTNITGTYSFNALGPGKYIVVVDSSDPDIPGGYAPSISQFAYTLTTSQNITTADFPFVPLISKQVSKTKVNPGETIRYTITANYPGSQLLTNVIVTDSVPAGSTYAGSASPSPASQPSIGGTGIVQWNLGSNIAGTPGMTAAASSTNTVTLDYTTIISDTWLNQNAPDDNYGNSEDLFTDREGSKPERSLIWFDLSSIPSGKTIISARLIMTKTGGVTDGNNVIVHRVSPAAVWDVGSGPAGGSAGDASWNERKPGTPWATAGGDYVSNASDPSIAVTSDGVYVWTVTDIVANWVTTGTTNTGFLLMADPEGGGNKSQQWASSENATTANRPKLEITYDGGPAAPATRTTLAAAPTLVSQGGQIQVSMVLTQVQQAGSSGSVDVRVGASSDDAEEFGPDAVSPSTNGQIYLISSDLELVADIEPTSSGTQKVGMRFTGVSVPKGATITNAYIRFRAIAADSPNTNNNTANLTVRAQAADNPTAFTSTAFNITNRTPTAASVPWTPVAWTTGVDYDTPDLKTVVQELVNRSGWSSGNSMVFIVTGTGSRSADSYDGSPSTAPLLHIEWSVPGGYSTAVVTPTLIVTGTNGVTASLVSGPSPASAVVTGTGTTFTWTYQANANGNTGSLVFGGGGSDGSKSWGHGVSNSVLVAPPLAFNVTATGAVDPVENRGFLSSASVIPSTPSNKVQTAILASIGDTVFADLNGNGTQDVGEPGLSGVQVCATPTTGGAVKCATTDGNGNYRIFGLDSNTNYTVALTPATIPAGYLTTTPNPLTVTSANFASSGNYWSAADFGLRPPAHGKIGDTVWLDKNENGVVDAGESGLPGVRVNLYNAAGTVLMATTTTNASGYYTFTGLYAGSYQVRVDETSVVTSSFGVTSTIAAAMDRVGGTLNPRNVALATDSSIVSTADFGYNWGGSIGDYVWYDNNGNKVQEGTPPDAGGVNGASLLLYYDVDGNGEFDPGTDTPVDFTQSNSSGIYLFDNLPPGNYIVKAEEQTVVAPPGSANAGLFGVMVATTGTKKAVTLAANQDYVLADFGFIEAGELEGTVFHDVDSSGNLGGGEPGLTPVTVLLTGVSVSGSPISLSVDTNADGEYKFIVPPGTYTITYDVADVLAIDGSLTTATTPTSLTTSVAAGQEVDGLDFGVDHSGKVGDTVFLDADGNSSQGSSEPGISGVTVELRDAGNNLLGVAVTDGDGHYLFVGLPNGTYTVTVLEGPGTPINGYTRTTGSNPRNATVSGGGADLSADFGYQPPVITRTIGGRVYNDVNNNADDNTEPGFPNVTVSVTCGGTVYTTLSDGSGNWQISGIPNGSSCTLLDADENDLPSASFVATETPATPITVNGNITGLDFGYNLRLGSISGTVCVGTGDGICSGSDSVLPGVTLTMTYAGDDGFLGTGDDIVQSMVSGGSGYTFSNLEAGLYRIDSTNLPGYESVADADGGNPDSIIVSLAPSQNVVGRDFEDKLIIIPAPDYVLTKTRNGFDSVRKGETISFTIRITNTGNVPLTNLPLRDTYVDGFLVYIGATPAPDLPNAGQLEWTDLTGNTNSGFGADLQPGGSFVVHVYFVGTMDTTSLPGGVTENTATVQGAYYDPDGPGGTPQVNVPDKTAKASVQVIASTAVALADTSLAYADDAAHIGWQTVNESDLIGFFLYRSADGGAQERVHGEMIPAQKPGQSDGAAYSYTDRGVEAGKRYSYAVEFVGVDGALGRQAIGDLFTGARIFLPTVGK